MRKRFAVLVLASSVICSYGQGVPGGIMTQDPNDPEYMIKAWKAAKEINSSGENLMIPMMVVKAQSQVVAGMRYILEVVYGESTCLKSLYRVEIWEKAWENFEQFKVTKIRDILVGMHI
ncbi:hypothetical protein Aduo_016549 [Ancylostoma duodenale]